MVQSHSLVQILKHIKKLKQGTRKFKQGMPINKNNVFLPNNYKGLTPRSFLSNRNQSTDLLCKSMICFLYDRDLRHENVKRRRQNFLNADPNFSCRFALNNAKFLFWTIKGKCENKVFKSNSNGKNIWAILCGFQNFFLQTFWVTRYYHLVELIFNTGLKPISVTKESWKKYAIKFCFALPPKFSMKILKR